MTNIKVTTMDTELEFIMPSKTTGQELFRQICRNLGIRESWYFGLMFKDTDGEDIWIDISRKAIKEFRDNARKLKFRVKFFPEDVAEELIEDTTIRYFYLQVRSGILGEKVYCPPDTCVLLASYSCQVRHGNYDSKIHENGFLSKEKLLPDRVYQQHNLKREQWENNILKIWEKHSGMLHEDAMLEYLKLAQNLEMYGIHYFNIYNRKGSNLILGVTALGMNVYHQDDKLNPSISFPWAEIRHLNFKDRKFTIKAVDKKAKDFVFFAKDGRVNKRILNLGIGSHMLYIRRRKPESLEVIQMKAKAAEQKKIRLEQRDKLRNEILAREQSERREHLYQQQLRVMKEEMERSQANLMEAQRKIEQLQQHLRELQAAKEKLELRQQELQMMMEKFEMNKFMEATERQKLENEIQAKRLEVLRIQQEVELRDEEARKLQAQVDEARRKEEEMTALLAEEAHKGQELETLPDGANVELPVLVEVNELLREQVKILQQELTLARDETKDTPMDKIHRHNLREGKDKYKTLNEIRKGNTIRRVDMFENM